MKRSNILFIAAAILVILAGFFFLIFEIKEVSDLKWQTSYDYSSKEAYGTWLFKSLIEEKYGSDQVKDLKDGFELDTLITNSLYVFIGNSHLFEQRKYDSLEHFLSLGNTALIISEYLTFPKDSLDLSPYDVLDYYIDSLVVLDNCDDSIGTYDFYQYQQDLVSLQENELYYLDDYYQDSSYVFRPILCAGDSMNVFVQDMNYNHRLYYHFHPNMFVNYAAHDSSYLDHFNFVFSEFDAEHIFLDCPGNHGFIGQDENTSPLKYVLRNRSLAWAYYLTVATAILFLIFGSKRKQKPIPVVQQNVNSSLEYVEVLSELFKAQDQNEKLVIHIHDNFNHEIEKRYYIKANSDDFLAKLVRKSGVPEKRLKKIFYYFKKAQDKRSISDEELTQLYNQIEYFNKNAI